MKYHILIIKIFYSNSENFWKCSVCVRFDFVSCLSSEEESLRTLETSTINTILLSPQLSTVCSQETYMPGDRNGMLCSHCVGFTFAWGYCIAYYYKIFCILCSVPNRCRGFTAQASSFA